MKKIFDLGVFLIRDMYERVGEHQMTAYAAQMAYFFVLSIFPFLIIAFAVLGKLDITYSFMSTAYQQLVPPEAYTIIDGYIKSILSADLETVVPISLLASLWTASHAVGALERALNRAHEVTQTRRYLSSRFFSLLVTILILLLLLISLVLPSLTKGVLDLLSMHLSLSEHWRFLITYGRWGILITMLTGVLLLIQIAMPNCKMTIAEALPGVVLSILGWGLLSIGFSLFVRSFSNISFVYGSLGAVITLMIWLYFVGMLLMLGAELNASLMKWRRLN